MVESCFNLDKGRALQMPLFSQNEMMHESDEEIARRNEILRIYHASKDALKIIGDVSVSTISTTLPPPVERDNTDYEIVPRP